MREKERTAENEREWKEKTRRKRLRFEKKERVGRGWDFSTLLGIKGAAIAGRTVALLLGPGFAIESERARERAGTRCLRVAPRVGPARGLWPPVRASQLDSLVVHAAAAYPGLPMAHESASSLLSSPVFDFPHASSYVRSFEKKSMGTRAWKKKRW